MVLRVPYSGAAALAAPPTAVPGNDYLNVQASPADFGAQVGGAEQRAGAEIGQGGQRLAETAIQTQQLVNRNNALDATSKLRDGLNNLTSQFMQLKGQAAVNALPAYNAKVKELQSSLSQGLGNLDAQTDFKQASNWFLSFHGSRAQDYAVQQAHVGAVQANVAAADQATNDAVQFANDPVKFGQFLMQSRVHAQDGASFSSSDPNVVAAAGQDAYDKNARRAILAVAETDPLHAQSLYETIRPRLSPVAAAAIDAELKPLVLKSEGDKIVNGVFGVPAGSLPSNTTIAEIMPALLHQESGTRQFGPDGQPLVSSKGAVGIAQVLPSTAQEFIPGVDLARLHTDAAYNRTVGQTIISDLLDQFHDPTLALAAYNAGSGAVQQWIKQFGDPRTGAITDQEFVSKIPIAETRGYVTAIASDIAATNGTAQPAPLDPDAMIQRAVDETAGNPGLQAYVVPRARERASEMLAQQRVHVEAVRKQVHDVTAGLLSGGDFPIPTAAIKTWLPADEASSDLYELGVAKQAGTFLKSMQWADPATVEGGLKALDANSAGPESPEEFTFHQRVIAAATRAVVEQQKRLLADPGAYVASNPQIAALEKKAQGDGNPQDIATWGNAVLALEDHLGVPASRQHILSVHQAQSITQKLTADPNADSGAALDGLAQKYGTLWPRLYGDLVTLGKLPPEWQVLATMDNPSQMVARNDFQQALLAERKEGGLARFQALLSATDKKAIDGTGSDLTLHNAIAPLAATLRFSGGAGIQAIGMVRGAVQSLATYYAISKGMSGAAAVRAAADAIISERYDFDGTQRVPKGQLADVEQAEAVTVAGLKTSDLWQLHGRVPAIAKERESDFLGAARAGFWVTNGHDDGVQLMIRLNNGAAFPVQGANGKAVQILFSDVPSILAGSQAARRAAAAAPHAPGLAGAIAHRAGGRPAFARDVVAGAKAAAEGAATAAVGLGYTAEEGAIGAAHLTAEAARDMAAAAARRAKKVQAGGPSPLADRGDVP